MKTFLARIFLAAALFGVTAPVRAALYTVGSVVENFSLVDRATGKPVQLTDFAGKIVVLDWFAWWCPFCQAAAPQLLTGVDEWYAARGGNPAGIPVVHVGINLQSGQEVQTQNFVTRAKLDLVLQDFNRALANRVATDGQPIFAIINGVTNSPTHKPWQLLYSRRGYGQTSFPVVDFRAAIDAVKAPVVVPRTPPSITGSPTSQTVNPGAEVVFSVTAIGTPTLTYQWRRGSKDLAGQNAPTLVLKGVTAADAGIYDVVVSNGDIATSAPAVLTVRTAPSITTGPVSQTVNPGDAVTFLAAAIGDPTPTFQWMKGGKDLPGETRSTLSLAKVTTADAGDYAVVVTNPAGSATSGAVLTVRIAPSITTGPVGQTIDPGDPVTFRVTAAGSPPLTYQWRKHGVELSGETRDVLALAKATAADADTYDVVVTNPAGSVVSAAAVLVVRVPPVLGVLAARPDGSLAFSVRGGAGSAYRLESSADLETWTPDGESVAAGSDGSVTVPAGALSSGRFFRIIVR